MNALDLSTPLKNFINSSNWIFAKTYAKTWPHEYIVQDKVDNNLFLALAKHVDSKGYKDNFYKKEVVYFDHDGHTYWHMVNIINRCVMADTYHQRKIDDRLPD